MESNNVINFYSNSYCTKKNKPTDPFIVIRTLREQTLALASEVKYLRKQIRNLEIEVDNAEERGYRKR